MSPRPSPPAVPTPTARFRAHVGLAAAAALVGCFDSSGPTGPAAPDPFDGGAVPATCAPPECTVRTFEWLDVAPPDRVDLLLVVDDASAMVAEQAALREVLPGVVRALSTGDLQAGAGSAGEGSPDFVPPASVHVGVVTTDMGSGGFATGCPEPLFGDDGRLQSSGNPARDPGLACVASYDAFQRVGDAEGASCRVDATGALPDACAARLDAIECTAAVGTAGCVFTQPLESMLKAVTPAGAACTAPHCNFFMGTRGRGDDAGSNRGFLRDGSLLAVWVLTDGEDCSAADLDLFNPRSSRYTGPLALRCVEPALALHPIDRYVEGLLDRRAPARLAFGVTGGVPTDLLAGLRDEVGRVDPGRLLDDPRMRVTASPDGSGAAPSCTSPSGAATPPRRLVELAEALAGDGAAVDVGSTCGAGLDAAAATFTERLARRLAGACLPTAPPRDGDGFVPCRLTERPPPGETCGDLPGRTVLATGGDGEVCRVEQRAEPGAGWTVVDAGEPGAACARGAARLAFGPGAEPRVGSVLSLECREPRP